MAQLTRAKDREARAYGALKLARPGSEAAEAARRELDEAREEKWNVRVAIHEAQTEA